jgi:transcriptional regulator with XRE-family HTH domain
MLYEHWSLAIPNLPPRSRLYSLPPIGVGTPQVESLTSYVMRLAEAHAVSPGTLIRQEILSGLADGPKRPYFTALHSLNGMGLSFEQWVSLLEKLTVRSDLNVLTLLPWKSVFASAGILRRQRAWCIDCYQEYREHGQTAYDSLLWTIGPITVCPQHETFLQKYCPHCQHRLLLLSAYARPGVCSYCNGWLGGGPSIRRQDESKRGIEDQLWIAQVVGDLLALGNIKHKIPRNRARLRSNIDRAIADWANGNRLLFCRVARIPDKTVMEWLNGDCLPSLALLIRLSQNLRVPLTRFLLEEIIASDPIWVEARQIVQAEQSASITRTRALRLRPEYSITRGRRWALSPREREACKVEIKASMEATLQQDVPQSVRDIFRSLGYRNCSMGRYWFPELCDAIKAKRRGQVDRYRQELRAAIAEEPAPTVAQVAQRLGISLCKLRHDCPELCRALSLRYPDRQRFQRVQTEEALKKALKEPPVPLFKLAVRLHTSVHKLRLTHPDLCARLRQLYINHQSSELQHLHLIYEDKVRQAIDEVTAASKYPSRKRVLAFISKRNPAMTSIYLTGKAMKRIRAEAVQATSCEAWARTYTLPSSWGSDFGTNT